MNLMKIRMPKNLMSRRGKCSCGYRLVIHINCPTHSLGGTTITWAIKREKDDENICLSMRPTEAEL